MSYASLDDLQVRLGPAAYVQLTDDEGTGSANTVRANEALQAALAEIDSRLACRCAVPVDVSAEPPAAALLKALALDLAVHRLHARRPPVPDAVREAAVTARQWLADFVRGQAHLPVSRPVAQNPAAGILAECHGVRRVFRCKEGD